MVHKSIGKPAPGYSHRIHDALKLEDVVRKDLRQNISPGLLHGKVGDVASKPSNPKQSSMGIPGPGC